MIALVLNSFRLYGNYGDNGSVEYRQFVFCLSVSDFTVIILLDYYNPVVTDVTSINAAMVTC